MNHRIRRASWIGCSALGLLSGCCSNVDVDRFADINCGAIPEPPQVSVRRHFELQAAKAEADDFVFYRHEFYMDGKELGPYGQYHVRAIANRLEHTPFPVLVQAVPDARLNEERRQTVIAALKRAGLDHLDQRVIVGFSEAEGMSGDEAERVYNALPQAGTGVNGNGGAFRNNNPGNNFFNNGYFNSGRNGAFQNGRNYPFY